MMPCASQTDRLQNGKVTGSSILEASSIHSRPICTEPAHCWLQQDRVIQFPLFHTCQQHFNGLLLILSALGLAVLWRTLEALLASLISLNKHLSLDLSHMLKNTTHIASERLEAHWNKSAPYMKYCVL